VLVDSVLRETADRRVQQRAHGPDGRTLARSTKFSREAQDIFSVQSQQRYSAQMLPDIFATKLCRWK